VPQGGPDQPASVSYLPCVTLEIPEWIPGGWGVGLPRGPGIYAMYAGEPPCTWVAYVGTAGNLHARLFQHFVRRDSSVVAAAAVHLDLDYIRYVEWWEHQSLTDDTTRLAAELVAFDVFEPALRSRGVVSRPALELYSDPDRHAELERIFAAEPTGRFVHARLPDVARQVYALEARIAALEETIRSLRG
jgi:hypothetical protein